jgi:hypothetical protein
MKKLNKLEINSEKLMKNEELVTLRGGYGSGWVKCFIGSVACANNPVATCEGSGIGSARWFCNTYCPSWTNLVCAGG